MPFGEYKDFDDCVKKNQDKEKPEAYCATIEKKITGKWPSEEGYKKKLEKLRKRFEACSTGNVPTATLLKKKNEVN